MRDLNEPILLEKVWKAPLQAYPDRSLVTLKSLWELLYDADGRFLKKKAIVNDSINTSIGCSLDHDIICFSSLEYSANSPSENDVSYAGKNLSKQRAYELLGIDVSIAKYDSRSKPLLVPQTKPIVMSETTLGTLGGLTTLTREVNVFNNDDIICYDRNAALMPVDIFDFIQHGIFTDKNLAEINSASDYYGSGKTNHYLGPSVTPLSSAVDNGIAIYLNNEDTTFRGTLTTDNTLKSYNKLFLNPENNTWVPLLVLKSLYDQFKNNGKAGFITEIDDWKELSSTIAAGGSGNTLNTSRLCDFVFLTLPSLIDGGAYTSMDGAINANGTWATLLKHTFVWIKSAFFGDYIQPDVFNQDLTSDSNVVHKNIVLSKDADFNKYDTTTKKDIKADTASYPYVPITSPGFDIVTPKLVNTIHPSDTEVTYNKLFKIDYSTINDVIKNGDKDEGVSEIGSIRFAPNLRDKSLNALPNYFDPEADYAQMDFQNRGNDYHMPTLIPASGNIYADGRIISPTIDELWVYIKTLTEGRRADNSVNLPAAESDSARAINRADNSKIIEKDTILTAAAANEYTFNLNNDSNTAKYGDIINVSVEADLENNENIVKPTEFINNNSQIKYNIYNALKRLSKDITTFDVTEPDENNNTAREITNFTAWYKVYDKNDEEKDKRVKDGEYVSVSSDGNIWQPRSEAPYSLRELEALAKGNKYNIITLASFVKENFSVVGQLGYRYYDDETVDSIGTAGDEVKHPTQAAGSLYQFHRDYNYNVDNPNTFFRMNGEGDTLFDENGHKNITTSGYDASFNDLATAEAKASEQNILLYNSTKPKTSKMPLLVRNYGKSVYLSEEFGSYSGADIYMAADGTWRYKAEHSRVPILRSRY